MLFKTKSKNPYFNKINERTCCFEFKGPLSLNFLLFSFFFLISSTAFSARTYVTTGASTDWNSPSAWICSGGGCNSNPVPGPSVNGQTVLINHNINYDSNNRLKITGNSSIEISNGATFTMTNAELLIDGEFSIDNGTLKMLSNQQFKNNGTVTLTVAVIDIQGEYKNNGPTNLTNSCIVLRNGSFDNNGLVNGDGSVQTLNGNIISTGTWSSSVEYCSSGSASGIPIAENCQAANAVCECQFTNCDIAPGYFSDPRIDQPIGNALFSLANNFNAGDENPNEFIFTINDLDEVLIEIVVLAGMNNYAAAIGFLEEYNKFEGTDFYIDNIDPNQVADELLITLYFPIVGSPNPLLDLNAQAFLSFAREVNQGITGVITQGDFAQGTLFAREGWDKTGAGVKIGVISDSYAAGDIAAKNVDIASGELPGPGNPNGKLVETVAVDYPFPGQTIDEGRAMLQIIHDIAPDAELFFRTGFISEGNMAAGVRELRNQKLCDIIVDDVQYITEPFFKDGLIAQAIDEVADDGALYFSAAGNFANRSFTDDFTAAAAPNNNRHQFDNGNFLQSMNLAKGNYLFVLQWDDDWYSLGENNGATNDLDIYLASNNGNIEYGFNRNNIGEDPVEIMPFTVTNVNGTTTNIMIERVIGNGSPKFKYVVFRSPTQTIEAIPEIGTSTDNSTIVGHATAEGAITVGAVYWENTPNYGRSLSPEPFTSLGGTPVKKNNVFETRVKPDIMAPDGVSTTVEFFPGTGIPPFFGTSAAAPHAAAAAALLLEAQTSFGISPQIPVESLLKDYALDMESGGFDYISGEGFIQVDAAMASFSVPAPQYTTFDLSDLGGTDPGSDPFTLTIEGDYFVPDPTPDDGIPNGTVVYFRGEILETTFINAQTLSVEIPAYIGNPPLYISTPSSVPNDNDGGDTPEFNLDDTPPVQVVLEVVESTKRYGEAPPSFEYVIKIDGVETTLPVEEKALLDNAVSYEILGGPDPVNDPLCFSCNIGIYGLQLSLVNLDIGLEELYDFSIVQGNLIITPMPVTIKPETIGTLTYGDAVPNIQFEYIYGETGEPATVDADVMEEIATQHTNALILINALGVLRGLPLVNAGNALVLINNELFIDLGDGNPVPLNNKTFFVSQNQIASAAAGMPLINGAVEFGADLFSQSGIDAGAISNIVDGTVLINGQPLINGQAKIAGTPLINAQVLINRAIVLINGQPLINNETCECLPISISNGQPLVNGQPLINNEEGGGQYGPMESEFGNVYVILNEADGNSESQPIDIVPINVLTGLDVGTQYIIPGGFFNDNLIINYAPTEFEVEPADLIITPDDESITYGETPDYSGTVTIRANVDDYQYNDNFNTVFGAAGVVFDIEGCATDPDCNVGMYDIGASATDLSMNYEIQSEPKGTLTISPFELIASVEDATMTYGQDGPPTTTVSFDPPEGSFPFGQTIDGPDGVFTEFTFSPDDGCSGSTSVFIAVENRQQPTNYNVTYNPGVLSYSQADLVIAVETSFIPEGDPLPSTFSYDVQGLVCDNPVPPVGSISFTVLNANGQPAASTPVAGEYDVYAVLNDSDYDNYVVNVSPGKLYVNPLVDCNDRIKPSILCEIDNYSLPGYSFVTKRLAFKYENDLSVPIFIENGPDNILFGPATFVGLPPEVFEPGVDTFHIYTDDKKLTWKITTPGNCNHGYSSSSGSNASPNCNFESANAFQSEDVKNESYRGGNPEGDNPHHFNSDQSQIQKNTELTEIRLYPNPAADEAWLEVGNWTGEITVQIYSNLGQLLFLKSQDVFSGEKLRLDLSEYNAGLLSISVDFGDERKVLRLVKR